MGFLSPDPPDITVPEPARTRPKQPPEKQQTDVQREGRQRRRSRGRGRGETVLTGQLGGGQDDQTSSLLGG